MNTKIINQENLVEELQEKATSLDSNKKISTILALEAWKSAQISADEEQRKLSQMQTEDFLINYPSHGT